LTNCKVTNEHLCFYWIDKELVTCSKSDYPYFSSNDLHLLYLNGLGLYNKRKNCDFALLDEEHWSGMKVGIDGYPVEFNRGLYCIAGGDDSQFRATSIEFHGI
jgi:hypothetical protein